MDAVKFAGPFVGQFIYFEQIQAAPPAARRALARAALNVSGESEAHPILLSEIVDGLSWDEYQVFVGMLMLYAHTQLRWNDLHLEMLRRWAS
jgi:hypothetical protein